MHNLSAVVTLYFPTQKVIDNIQSYLHIVDKLYIVNNSGTDTAVVNKLTTLPNTSLLYSGENLGIAKALNLALEKAKKDRYTWLMTMDQDTSFEPDQIEKYVEHFIRVKERLELAVVAPLYTSHTMCEKEKNPYVERETVITSANIVNIDGALHAGSYDENLFIDEVDHAFCFALKEKNYTILQDMTVQVNHSIGTPYSKNSKIKLYPPFRLYYMVRNYLYLRKKYLDAHPLFFKQRDHYLIGFFLRQLWFGGSLLQRVSYMWRGLQDYRKKNFGKYNG